MRMPRSSVAVLLVLLVACGAGARTKTLQATLIAANVARDTFREIGRTREDQIIEACTVPPECTKEQAHAKVDAFRLSVAPIVDAISTAYQMIGTAFSLDDSKSVAEATAAVGRATKLMKETR
jgi:hypothetical protein